MFLGHAVACARHSVGCWAWLTPGVSQLSSPGCTCGPYSGDAGVDHLPTTMSDGWVACVELAAVTAAVLQPSCPCGFTSELCPYLQSAVRSTCHCDLRGF